MSRWMAMAVLLALVFWPVLAFSSNRADAGDHGAVAIDQLVRDVCGKQVVLLGEDLHHGGGRTLEVKTRIVKRLVDDCGFRGVLFESSFYEFVHFQHLMDEGRASSGHLADAIGAKWATTDESRLLVDYLFAHAAADTVKLGGLDPQIGDRMAHYEGEQLADDLVRYLPQDRQQPCLTVLRRHDRWSYDDAHPFDAAAMKGLRMCVGEVRAALAKLRHKGRKAREAAAMARSYGIYLAMQNAKGQAGPAMRDRAMFDHLRWFLARWPRHIKVVVWTATVHAVKHRILPGSYKPLSAYVHESYGNRAAAIGFTALDGRYGWPGKPSASISTVLLGSLERSIPAHAGSGPWYLDSRALRRLGRVPGLVLNYAKSLAVDWSGLVDGVVVLRHEHPPVPLKRAWQTARP